MVWIFALGIIGFCIVFRGFRKLVLFLIAFVACITGAVVAYNLYQSHVQEQQRAQQRAQEKIDAAKYPLCVGKDQLQAFLDSGGKCRQSTGDPDMDAVLVEDQVAKIKAAQIK